LSDFTAEDGLKTLGHIPQAVHGFDVVTAVSNALAGGAAGGGIGAAIAAAAKSLVPASVAHAQRKSPAR
jgi:hypothetical protein